MDPGVELAVAVNAVVVVLVALAYRYRRRLFPALDRAGAGTGVQSWYGETATMARELQDVLDPALSGTAAPDDDRVLRRVLPLSGRFENHARNAPPTADPEVVDRVFDLGAACRRVGMEHASREARRTGVFLEDELAALLEDARELERAAGERIDDD